MGASLMAQKKAEYDGVKAVMAQVRTSGLGVRVRVSANAVRRGRVAEGPIIVEQGEDRFAPRDPRGPRNQVRRVPAESGLYPDLAAVVATARMARPPVPARVPRRMRPT